MQDIRTAIYAERLYFDGGFGTMLQDMGLAPGEPPELWNLSHPDRVCAVHAAYRAAGSRILTTNTFGINREKYANYTALIAAAVHCARQAAGEDAYVAFDMGPTGRMLAPLGDLPFEEAVEIYAANVRAAVACGVDLILIETMNDCYETKAAVLAAKENCDLPVFVTNVYDESGKLMTGADPLAMIALLEGLRVDAIGMNCACGPDLMVQLIDQFTEHCSLPLIVNPNAGLPRVVDGKTVYDISPEMFAEHMVQLAQKGAAVLGGCCGTTPAHIAETVRRTSVLPVVPPAKKSQMLVSSYTHAVEIGAQPILIGERINPTGKSKLKAALRAGDMQYILNEGIRQSEAGVHLLDVNVGLPEIDEVAAMCDAVTALQAVTDLPLQLDSADPKVLAAALRLYNGKALINSVNGEIARMEAVFPLVQKYGGTVVALTMDENGIPDTAAGRLAIAERIAAHAAAYGIGKNDLLVDPLCLAISADQNSARITLKAVELLRQHGFHTSLGVSNISFGLPAREKLNTVFFAAALERGLNAAIMNPFASGMMDVYYAHRALHGLDAACSAYIDYATAGEPSLPAEKPQELSLRDAVIRGLKAAAITATTALLRDTAPMAVIDQHIIPALDAVGESFAAGDTYLPQLLMSAEAATASFDTLKAALPPKNAAAKHGVILATVKGDIHDIGKNIVKVLLQSHGFAVVDLGRDVLPQTICQAVAETGCMLVGLSALMTTTVPAMEETVRLLHARFPDVKVMVGGAVLHAEYASMIGADHYSPDAMGAVRYAQDFYKE